MINIPKPPQPDPKKVRLINPNYEVEDNDPWKHAEMVEVVDPVTKEVTFKRKRKPMSKEKRLQGYARYRAKLNEDPVRKEHLLARGRARDRARYNRLKKS